MNVRDLMLIAANWGTYAPAAGSVAQVTFDVNKSGRVDVLDMHFVARRLWLCG